MTTTRLLHINVQYVDYTERVWSGLKLIQCFVINTDGIVHASSAKGKIQCQAYNVHVHVCHLQCKKQQ